MSLFRNLLISSKLDNGDEIPPGVLETKWIYGITPPDPKSWVQLFPELYHNYYLPWKKEYGWYDCKKLNPTNNPSNPIEDGNLCWAATASNLVHWWITQNKEYIDKYGDKYKGPDYTYPLDKPQESDIFQLFTDSFVNEAGKGDDGVNWFIHGDIPTLPELRNPEYTAGYFKDVFPEGVKLGKNIGGLGKISFNNAIKDALDNNKAIGVTRGTVRDGHVVTLWGFEFDENGDVAYLYMADNNDRDLQESYGVGCMRLRVVYVPYPEGGDSTQFKSGYIEDNRSIALNRLVTLDLGQDYWKSYLGEE